MQVFTNNIVSNSIKKLCFLLFFMLLACKLSPPKINENQAQGDLAQTDNSPTLTVGLLNHTTTDSEGLSSLISFQQDLLEHFAEVKGYRLIITTYASELALFSAIEQQRIQMALFDTPVRKDWIKGPDILSSKTQLIYKRGNKRPQSFEDLSNEQLVVQDNHRFREQATFLTSHYPDIKVTFSNKSQEALLKEVNEGRIDHTLIESSTFLRLRSRYHRTKVAYDAFYPESLNWIFTEDTPDQLLLEVDTFFAAIKENGSFTHIKDKHFGHVNADKPLSSLTFFNRVDQRLPQFQDLIEQIATKYGLDWRLIAAISYQESHWNPRAKSPTGVRGMMMLTLPTAKELGVKNRLDPAASLEGGAQYLVSLLNRLPETIKEPDRTWFALAAYNVGLGHLYDAQEITAFHGANPNRWVDVKKYLPLLEKEDWYQYTKHGKARGREPVKYVQYIRHFKDLLEWQFPLTQGERALLAKKDEQKNPQDEALLESQLEDNS